MYNTQCVLYKYAIEVFQDTVMCSSKCDTDPTQAENEMLLTYIYPVFDPLSTFHKSFSQTLDKLKRGNSGFFLHLNNSEKKGLLKWPSVYFFIFTCQLWEGTEELHKAFKDGVKPAFRNMTNDVTSPQIPQANLI